MNTVLSTRVHDTRNHPPPPGEVATARRVTLPDRVALHLGLALITWSRRPRTAPTPPREYNPNQRREQAAARDARERQWQQAMYFGHHLH